MQKTQLRTFDIAEPVTVELDWPAGEVELIASHTDQISVTISGPDEIVDKTEIELLQDRLTISCSDIFTSCREVLRESKTLSELELQIEVPTESSARLDTHASELDIKGTWLKISGKTNSGDVVIQACAELSLRSQSGDVVVEKVAGPASIKTQSGDCRVNDVAQELSITTSSGDIHCDQSRGNATLKSSSGDITLEQGGGTLLVTSSSGDISCTKVRNDATVTSVSGDIKMGFVGAQLQITNTSGDIDLGQLPSQGKVEVRTVAGSVRAIVPHEIPVWTNITSVSGGIYNGLAPRGEPTPGSKFLQLHVSTITGSIKLQED